ncbi:NADPH-dependent F420 reductase [Peribacillus glennii]|uniref:NADPH-dependent F420 reductase n=1 Tax=Peribacillus glennii TaxID=2303991 RepID=A0A372LHQ1_9BACI|nr:NADPH-dependent F420 reductase [Peribacillus glennii]RFU65136.1 NADPH-dependent F420 reductase [Peribacillus glennii]
METISIIGGTGNQGKGLALRLGMAGYPIILGSRSSEKAIKVTREIKEEYPDINIEGVDNETAAERGDIVIMTIPFNSQRDIVEPLKEKLRNKIVVDTTVALIPGKPPTTESVPEGSAAERLQSIVGPDVQVISAFHTISAHLLENMNKALEEDTLVAGDDKSAKEKVIELANNIGLRGLNAGPLKISSTLERITALVIGMNIRYKKKSIGVHFSNI